MAATIEALEGRYGSIEGYLVHEAELDPSTLADLRAVMLEPLTLPP